MHPSHRKGMRKIWHGRPTRSVSLQHIGSCAIQSIGRTTKIIPSSFLRFSIETPLMALAWNMISSSIGDWTLSSIDFHSKLTWPRHCSEEGCKVWDQKRSYKPWWLYRYTTMEMHTSSTVLESWTYHTCMFGYSKKRCGCPRITLRITQVLHQKRTAWFLSLFGLSFFGALSRDVWTLADDFCCLWLSFYKRVSRTPWGVLKNKSTAMWILLTGQGTKGMLSWL